jgi:hypothetical protein
MRIPAQAKQDTFGRAFTIDSYSVGHAAVSLNFYYPLTSVWLMGDCAAGRGLTKNEDEETIIINRPGTSTYPEEKTALTSGATP